MLKSVSLSKVASYGPDPVELTDLTPVNFIYGGNAVGKTTLGRVLADQASYPGCGLQWRASPFTVRAYNHDFVEHNFGQGGGPEGVFTLGSDTKEAEELIQGLQKKRAKQQEKLASLRQQLDGDNGNGGGRRGDLIEAERNLAELCWKTKSKYDSVFREAMTGFRHDKKLFRDQCLKEAASREDGSAAERLPCASPDPVELQALAATIYGDTPELEPKCPEVVFDELAALESDPLFGEPMLGAGESPLAPLISHLKNSDWVRKGRRFLSPDADHCPFCQQTLPAGLEDALSTFFGPAYTSGLDGLKNLQQRYIEAADQLEGLISRVIDHPRIDKVSCHSLVETLRGLLRGNLDLIRKKCDSPSAAVALISTSAARAALNEEVIKANAAVDAHNDVVGDLGQRREKLKNDVWDLICEDTRPHREAFAVKESVLTKAIKGMESGIETAEDAIADCNDRIRTATARLTSVQPTVDKINGDLAAYGFKSFRLTTAPGNSHQYQLERPDGSSAASNLSDGEKTFVTFLYFMASLRGHTAPASVAEDIVVVIDDPVSSLDSDVLFTVSTLIRDLLSEVERGDGLVKQAFVITHNVYFHKEVTERFSRGKLERESKRSFWMLRRPLEHSVAVRYPRNPIQTSYQLLWHELSLKSQSGLHLQNTLRRILENYFRIYGGVDNDEILGHFEGAERARCSSLLSWVNDGSHSLPDDLLLEVGEAEMQEKLDTFRAVFFKLGHGAHYDMMLAASKTEALTS